MYTHLDTLEALKRFRGIFNMFDVSITSSMSAFYVILQFLATASLKKNVEALDFHLEYVSWQDMQICMVRCVTYSVLLSCYVIIIEECNFQYQAFLKRSTLNSTCSVSSTIVKFYKQAGAHLGFFQGRGGFLKLRHNFFPYKQRLIKGLRSNPRSKGALILQIFSMAPLQLLLQVLLGKF